MGEERRCCLLTVTTALTLCLLSVSQGGASLVRARVGGSAELGCDLAPSPQEVTASAGAVGVPELFPLHVVEWVRLGYNVPILIKFGVYAPRVHPNYKGRVSLTRGASLLVERLTLEDEGWFECRILLLDSKTDEFRNGTWTFLSITAPPVFIKTPPAYVEVLLGDSLTLSCGAHGNPRPTVVWHKDETPIEKHEKIKVLNGSLSLITATRDTTGVYKCHVSNSEGNLTHSTQLQVKGPPIILISPGDTILNMSQDAVLQCQADAYPSNLTYEWLKQGQNVYHIESLKSRVKILVDGTLLIPNLMPEDAGNYTCIPTNGILTPPSASAHLKVKHPARVVRMSRETYLPAGMGGVIACPVQADPPLLYVNWTKDGNNINVDTFPGWMVNSEGSVFITTANDNAVGVYTCTAYNSYGTMGQSDPTRVILKDPPAFRVAPQAEYLEEVGRDLVIPCEAKGDPVPNITWSKIGPTPRSPYMVLANGSLLLQPLSKDHHGGWECLATNHVATVSAGTVVMALGTSPHAVTSVSVTTAMNQANVSWAPGFDGGFSQKFTVWVKQASRGKHEWASLPVPTSKDHLLVTGLLAATSYQFSVLPQNKLGSGPFSEIVSVRTQAVPTEAPLVVLALPALDPPTLLSANRTERGVLLQWSPPESPSSPVTGYVLQARREQGQWVVLSSDLGANQSDVLVQGLLRDSSYDLRLLSRSIKILSVPSESVNVSTAGMAMYPVRASFLEYVPQPLLAGVIGGVCFLSIAIVLAVVTACFMSHRRQKRRIKRRNDLHSVFQKSSSPEARRPPRSPDSILKLKLCPGLPFFPSSSASQSDRSTFDKGSRGEYQDQRKQLLSNASPPPHYTLFESHLGCQAPTSTGLESICRGPDGRFLVQPLPEGSGPPGDESLKNVIVQSNNGGASGAGSDRTSFRDSPKSSILSSEKEEGKVSPLTVDVPELSQPPSSPGRVKAMARNFSRHGCFYSDDEQGSEALLERASFYSDNSEKRTSGSMRRYCLPANADDLLPALGRRALGLERSADKPNPSSYQPMEREGQLTAGNSTLVSRLDSELEEDSVAKCLKLAKERQEMEEQLKAYTGNQRTKGWAGGEHQSSKANSPHRDVPTSEEDPVWKLKDVTLRQKHRPTGQTNRVSDFRKACYFGSTSSPLDRLPSSHIQWDISPVTSVTSIVPVRSPRHTPTRRPYPPAQGVHETMEDSLAVESSHTPVTQNTSLPTLSPSVASESSPILCRGSPKRGRSRSPDREADLFHRRSLADEGWTTQRQEAVRSKTPQAYGAEHWDATHRASPADRESPAGPALPYNAAALYSRSDAVEVTDRKESGSSHYSTSSYEHSEGGAKANLREDHSKRLHLSSGFTADLEKEGVRARSRRSDKCIFSESPSVISPLTIVEECESDQSHFSVPRMSDCFNVRRSASPPQKSPVPTSAILEYLSLPGFIEMSVDEPAEESEVADTSGQSSEHNSVVVKPDVVPRNWEVHCTENLETKPSQKVVSFEDDIRTVSAAEASLDADKKPDYRYSRQLEARDSSIKGRTMGRLKSPSPNPEKTSKQLYYEKSQLILGRGTKSPERPQSRLASSSAHKLLNAAKGVADIVSRHSQSFVEGYHSVPEPPERYSVPEPPERYSIPVPPQRYSVPEPPERYSIPPPPERHSVPEPPERYSIPPPPERHSVPEPPERYSIPPPPERHSVPEPPERYSIPPPPERYSVPEPPERHATQRNNRNNIASRICQAPVPFLKKSLSIGPCRTLSGMGHPRPFLKKSISLQRWEHFESPRAYISERCYWDEFPNPDVRVKSYSLGRAPSYLHRPGPTWTEYVPARRPSFEGLERPHHSQRPPANSPYLNYSMYPPPSVLARMEPSDPRRQPAVFPEVSRWSVSYQESLRSAQHKYVPMPSSIPPPQHQYRHISRGEPARAIDPRRGPPRSYLPRGNSWPSPHPAPPPPGEAGDSYRETAERPPVRAGEPEYRDAAREGGRTSYASLSSGRGSAGFLRQSLSITPTLLSSPETTEEGERHRAQVDRRERRAKRRNTSVDESYEWDSADPGVDAEVLEAMEFDQSRVSAGKDRGVFRHDQTPGPQDQKRQGPSSPVSTPTSNPSARGSYSRSLSEARFNALRLEYQEYMQALESSDPREARLTPDLESDSDSSSALL